MHSYMPLVVGKKELNVPCSGCVSCTPGLQLQSVLLTLVTQLISSLQDLPHFVEVTCARTSAFLINLFNSGRTVGKKKKSWEVNEKYVTSELLNWYSCASRVLQVRPGSRKDSRTYFIWNPGSCTQPFSKDRSGKCCTQACLIPQQWAKCNQFFTNIVRISDISRNNC